MIRDQFIGVYAPAQDWQRPPMFHVTRQDARRLVRELDAIWISGGKAIRIFNSAQYRSDIMIFVMEGDIVEHISEYREDRDRWWGGSSLFPGVGLMHANAAHVFWARVVTGAWHGFVKSTKGVPLVKVNAL